MNILLIVSLAPPPSKLLIYPHYRLLMATEIRSMRTYWHVQEPGTPNVARVYPGTLQLYFAITDWFAPFVLDT